MPYCSAMSHEPLVLTNLQQQVDAQIESRLSSICRAEWEKVNKIKGKTRKRIKPVAYPAIVQELLDLRQSLYNGTDPEAISATITGGEIAHQFEKSKK